VSLGSDVAVPVVARGGARRREAGASEAAAGRGGDCIEVKRRTVSTAGKSR